MYSVKVFKHCQQCLHQYTISNLHRRSLTNGSIKKVLIANRGEIACRISKTAKRLGIKVVAVYSDADKKSLHVLQADEAYHIGPAASAESYLRGEKLLGVAEHSKCQAIHPGYGFLSENADFSEQCANAGVIFIGPPASAIRDMGCKSTSKKIMEAAGVPVVKGYHGDIQDDSKLKEEADRIGYPVMLKALKGGGGKGMRVVLNRDDFDNQLASARNEAAKAFGDTAMLVESFVSHPRHVEVQVFGDQHGNYVHLHERDCSVQRRHQKIIEEAPAPGLPEEVRRSLGEAAVRAARAVGYVGAGTVEFILDAKTFQHFFMEMNTRLQVEHPVTEMITKTDLVEWQFKVASGEKLPLKQEDIPSLGHSFEARIYAEDPENGFLPQAGTLHHLRLPDTSKDVRVDTGVTAGDPVPVFYDPLIAKLIVWGQNRDQALERLKTSLADFQVSGVPTNINFLLALAKHSEFQNAKVHTNFIADHGEELLKPLKPTRKSVADAVSALLFSETRHFSPQNVFQAHKGFRVNHNLVRNLKLSWKGAEISIEVEYLKDESQKVVVQLENGEKEEYVLSSNSQSLPDGAIAVETVINGDVERCTSVVTSESIQVFDSKGVINFDIPRPKWQTEAEDDGSESLGQLAASPMPGVVDQLLVAQGDSVIQGQPLVTVIAMKMEYVVRAPIAGIVSELLHKPGDAVAKGTVLVRFQEEEENQPNTVNAEAKVSNLP